MDAEKISNKSSNTTDVERIVAKAEKAKAANSSWAADMVSRVVAAGQSIVSGRDNLKMASAPQRKTPFSNNQPEAVARVNLGQQATGPRDIRNIAAMDKDRQINNIVARARKMVEGKIGSLPLIGPDIYYLKADISRWDDHSGQPQTGRVSFQIPFHGPQGDPRTIYASVDLVMGDLLEPRHFTDGLNKTYAFDASGLKELFKGEQFDVVHQPKVTPEIKFTGPEFHAPDGQPGQVASKDSPMIFKKASGEMLRQATGEKPRIAREGLVRPLSKEAFDIVQPISPAEAKNPNLKPAARKPANAGTSTINTGTNAESNIGYPSGDQAPGHQTLQASAEVREVNWDGTIKSTTANLDLEAAIKLARQVTFGGHDCPVEIWNEGKLFQRVAAGKPKGKYRSKPGEIEPEPGSMDHHDSPSLEDEGKGLGSYQSSAGGSVRVASGLSKAIEDLQFLDMRMISFRDLVLLSKQHGKESDISFESASKELAKAGIVLYRTARDAPESGLARRLAHARRERLAAPEAEAPAAELPTAPTMPSAGQPAPGAEQGQPEGQAQIAPPSGLDPVEFREFQALLEQYNNQWETVHQREMNNIKNGNAPHTGIDYTDLQLLYDKIDAFQKQSKSRKSEELSSSPADLAQKPKTAPAEIPGATQAPQPGETGDSTILPEKGKGLAGVVPKMTRQAIEQAVDMKEQGATVLDGVETVAANTVNIDSATGGGTGLPKSASYELDDDAKTQMATIGLDSNDPEKVKEFMGTYKKMASHSLKFPEVCKNCKDLIVPVGYSPLKEFKHTRLPFCGAAKKPSVGFLFAYFRDCAGYDPIVKGIPQKVDLNAPEMQQTKKDESKGHKPMTQRAEALPSPNMNALEKFSPGHTGYGLDIRKWCIDNGHYARAGEVHPAHDWCTLWNTAVENLVQLPSGAVVPKSMAGQSSEPHGEGGPHQFGNTPNQTI